MRCGHTGERHMTVVPEAFRVSQEARTMRPVMDFVPGRRDSVWTPQRVGHETGGRPSQVHSKACGHRQMQQISRSTNMRTPTSLRTIHGALFSASGTDSGSMGPSGETLLLIPLASSLGSWRAHNLRHGRFSLGGCSRRLGACHDVPIRL